jgi:uncharacterized membrane protein
MESAPTEVDIRRICYALVITAGLLIAIMLIFSSFEAKSGGTSGDSSQSIAGWVAVVGAAVVFGSTGKCVSKTVVCLICMCCNLFR